MEEDERFIKLYEYCSSVYPYEVTKEDVMSVMDINALDFELNKTLIQTIIRLSNEEKSELEQ